MAEKAFGNDLGIGREHNEAMILLKCLEEHKKMGEGPQESSSDDVSCDEVVDPQESAKQGEPGDSEATDDVFEASKSVKGRNVQKDFSKGNSSGLVSNDESSEELDEYTRGL